MKGATFPGIHVYTHVCCHYVGLETEITRQRIVQLQKKYNDITSRAAECMNDCVSVRKLRYAVLCLPQNLKKEHKMFLKKAKGDVKEAETSDDIFYVVGEHCDYLSYSLLRHLIDLYGNDELKNEMADYIKQMEAFRHETRLEIFSEVCDDKPERDDNNFSTLVTKHQMDWATVTLEDVENIRKNICRELSLYEFSLTLLEVARGCVEITWMVPRSLVAYIQKSIKPSSHSMMKHHVSTLTIDGFIAYDSITCNLYISTVGLYLLLLFFFLSQPWRMSTRSFDWNGKQSMYTTATCWMRCHQMQ